MNCALIVDSRPTSTLDEVIQAHMDFLPGWHLRHWQPSISSIREYNEFMTSERLWEGLKSYEYVLVFQHDSGLLKEIEDKFFGYSYVGAPWSKNAPWARPDRAGGNGGLSLRDPRAMLELVKKDPFCGTINEDIYFVRKLNNLAPYEICKEFSVETEFQMGTTGWHAIDKYLTKEECNKIRGQYG